MPDADLVARVGVLHVAPAWSTMATDEQEAFNRRVLSAVSWADLPAPDRDLVRRGTLEVSAGRAPLVPNAEEWGDWEAIDAAIESGDDDALDVALATVGTTEGGGLRWDPSARRSSPPADEAVVAAEDGDFDEDGTELDEQPGEQPDDEAKALPAADDAGWVGL